MVLSIFKDNANAIYQRAERISEKGMTAEKL